MDLQKTKSQRYLIAYYLMSVIEEKKSFSPKLISQHKLQPQNQSFVTNSIFGCLRYYNRLDFIVNQLMNNQLKGKLRVIHYMIIQAIYQLSYLNTADHAAVFETVEATKQIDNKFSNLVNGVLRSFLRNKDQLIEDAEGVKLLPEWMIENLEKYYPSLNDLIQKNTEDKPPFWIRVNEQKISVNEYCKLLKKADIAHAQFQKLATAIHIKNAVNVEKLPGFEEGYFTIQDLHAQFAALILNPNSESVILDACAAPGGKTAQLANLEPESKITALEIDSNRAQRIKETVQRLSLNNVKIIVGDATKTKTLFEGQQFSHILLDVPCSATGVIRRNPDIRWLRKRSDIRELAKTQYNILCENWDLLEVGGYLLYTSCSILPTENQMVVGRFLNKFGNAVVIDLAEFVDEYIPRHTSVIDNYDFGLQLLPSHNYGDGFYYCLLQKLI